MEVEMSHKIHAEIGVCGICVGERKEGAKDSVKDWLGNAMKSGTG